MIHIFFVAAPDVPRFQCPRRHNNLARRFPAYAHLFKGCWTYPAGATFGCGPLTL
jgi:hypothetical protein